MSGDLDSVQELVSAFYRACGVTSEDGTLQRRGEDADDVAYYFLTRGTRLAQRWLLSNGFKGWLKRSSALAFSGTDAADGGRYTALPADFLKANGNHDRSCLVEAGGDRWGTEIDEDDKLAKGDYFYFRGTTAAPMQLWLARTASPPITLYLEYFYQHPEFESDLTLEFPLEARHLIAHEAANLAKEEAWFPGGNEARQAVQRALSMSRMEARAVARQSREPRRLRGPRRAGNRW